jgi:hypothetical protein
MAQSSFSRVNNVKIDDDFLIGRHELPEDDAGQVKQLLACDRLRLVSVLVGKVNNLKENKT